MKQKILTIWRDPVWSKVISFLVIAGLTIAYNFVVSKYEKSNFQEEFIRFWTLKLSLWLVALGTCIYIAGKLVAKRYLFKYDESTQKLDKDLYNLIKTSYLSQDAVLLLKNNTFSGRSFQYSELHSILRISEEQLKSDFEFVNPRLEKLKCNLIHEVDNFYSITSKYIFGTGNVEFLSIPSEWEFDQPERFDKAQNEIKQQEEVLSSKYDQFIRSCRTTLKV